MEIEIMPAAQEDLARLPVRIGGQILRKVERLRAGLAGDIKHLHQHDPAYRLRCGDYRVLFDVGGALIRVRRIKHRRDAYD